MTEFEICYEIEEDKRHCGVHITLDKTDGELVIHPVFQEDQPKEYPIMAELFESLGIPLTLQEGLRVKPSIFSSDVLFDGVKERYQVAISTIPTSRIDTH